MHSRGAYIADASEWLYYPDIPVPKQENGYDCGVFLIEYIRYLLSNKERIKLLLYDAPRSSHAELEEGKNNESNLKNTAKNTSKDDDNNATKGK